MSTWQQKYLKKDGLNETQIRILRDGPKRLCEAWILSALHQDYLRAESRGENLFTSKNLG